MVNKQVEMWPTQNILVTHRHTISVFKKVKERKEHIAIKKPDKLDANNHLGRRLCVI